MTTVDGAWAPDDAVDDMLGTHGRRIYVVPAQAAGRCSGVRSGRRAVYAMPRLLTSVLGGGIRCANGIGVISYSSTAARARDGRMATIEHSEIVRASPERVFDLLRRVEDFADYSDLIRSIDRLGENRYRWHVRAVGMDWAFDVEVTDIDPPTVLAWESLEGVKNQGRYQLRAVPEGTEVSLTLSYDIRNRLMEKAVNKAAKPLVGKVSRQILERVEARLNA